MADFQERRRRRPERRWIDRLVPDGMSGNYDFFRRVYQKLTADLKVPFQLQDGQRVTTRRYMRYYAKRWLIR